MDGYQSGQQYWNHLQPYLGSEKSTVHVSQDYGLFLHVPADADSDRGIRRTFSVYEHHSQADGWFRPACSYYEIHDTAYPFRPDMADVHRAVYLHAEYESKIQTRAHCRHSGGVCLSGFSIPVYQQPVVGVKVQRHLR